MSTDVRIPRQFVHMHIHVYACVCACGCMYVYMHRYMCMCMYVCMNACVYVRGSINVYVYVCVYMCMCIYVYGWPVCLQVHTYTWLRVQKKKIQDTTL